MSFLVTSMYCLHVMFSSAASARAFHSCFSTRSFSAYRRLSSQSDLRRRASINALFDGVPWLSRVPRTKTTCRRSASLDSRPTCYLRERWVRRSIRASTARQRRLMIPRRRPEIKIEQKCAVVPLCCQFMRDECVSSLGSFCC